MLQICPWEGAFWSLDQCHAFTCFKQHCKPICTVTIADQIETLIGQRHFAIFQFLTYKQQNSYPRVLKKCPLLEPSYFIYFAKVLPDPELKNQYFYPMNNIKTINVSIFFFWKKLRLWTWSNQFTKQRWILHLQENHVAAIWISKCMIILDFLLKSFLCKLVTSCDIGTTS